MLRKHLNRRRKKSVQAIDLFCGAGGLTRGFKDAGIDVILGTDIDPDCEYPYFSNNKVPFVEKSVDKFYAKDFPELYKEADIKILAGCAPCQPFSSYSHGKLGERDERLPLLKEFARLVSEFKADIVTMENVPLLEKKPIFADFVKCLKDEGFDKVNYKVVNSADYGVPQSRQRLVLLASRYGPIDMIEPTTPDGKRVNVRDVIGPGKVSEISAGQVCKGDPLHCASRLSQINLKRIRASKPNGTWRDWDKSLRAECHRKDSGRGYSGVYGRMSWDLPAPTITTNYSCFGCGRFGHPEQDRAISLREGALLQSFPEDYCFAEENSVIRKGAIGRMIGNAVPPKLGKAIGESIVKHVERHFG